MTAYLARNRRSEHELSATGPYRPLGELARPIRPRVSPTQSDGLRFVGLEHVESQTMRLLGTVAATSMKSSAIRFEPDDVMYGRLRPYLNKVYRPDFSGLGSAEFIVLTAGRSIEPKYLQYVLNSSRFVRFTAALNTGDRPRVDFDQMAGFPVPLPPLSTQRDLANRVQVQLSRLEAAGKSIARATANAHTYRDAILWDAFAVDAPRQAIETVAMVHLGSTPSRAKPSYWGGDISWVSSGEVRFSRISSTNERITKSGQAAAHLKLHPPGTVLLAMIGEGKTRGQAAILDIQACTNQNVAAIRPGNGVIPEWIYYFFLLRYEHTRRIGSGNNQPALTKAKVSAIELPIPTPVLQQAFIVSLEERLSVLEQMLNELNAGRRRAATLRAAVIESMLSGAMATKNIGMS